MCNHTYFTFAFWELGHQVLIVMDVGNVGLQLWCAWDLFGSQILVTTGGFELRISWIGSSNLTHKVITPLRPSGLGNCFICKRFEVQTLLWSLEFVIQINLEQDNIAVWYLARSWSISKKLNNKFENLDQGPILVCKNNYFLQFSRWLHFLSVLQLQHFETWLFCYFW